MSEAPLPLPLSLRIGLPIAALGLACGLSEAMLRVGDGNAFPQLDVFEMREGQTRLQANATARLRRVDGSIYTVRTGSQGLRLPLGDRGLVVGDSQVLGFGVEDDETFAARLGWLNAGVPGHGVVDALQHAGEVIASHHPPSLLVVLNQANDWEEGMRPAGERYVVRGGWLGSATHGHSVGASFWSSPLAQLHILAYPSLMIFRQPPPAAASTDPALALEFRTAFDALRSAWPEVAMRVAYLPADAATSEARAAQSPLGLPGTPWSDSTVRDATAAAFAGTNFIDLQPALSDPANFQEGDYHLSKAGHAAVADFLAGD